MLPLLPIALGLSKFIPDVVGFFAGDEAEDAASRVVDVAKQVTGIDDPVEAEAAIHASPELQLKFQQEANNLVIELEHENTKRLEIEQKNTAGARAREVALAKIGHGGAWVTGIVSLVVIVGFFWVLDTVIKAETVNQPTLLLLGSLGTAFGAVVNYYLGSSLGSYEKNKTVSQMPTGKAGK